MTSAKSLMRVQFHNLHLVAGFSQDRTQLEGIETAMESFKKAAGAFKYLQENFSNAPSMDMQEHTLDMLAQLMLVSYLFMQAPI